jgi:hypothetical protein
MHLPDEEPTATTRCFSGGNRGLEEKTGGKSTYPPPADGLCVLFLCKPGCSASEPAAQVGRGVLQRIGNFTECKVLKGNAAWLHSDRRDSHVRSDAGSLGFIGSKTLKRGFQGVFQNADVGLSRVCALCGTGGELHASDGWRGLWLVLWVAQCWSRSTTRCALTKPIERGEKNVVFHTFIKKYLG